MTVVSQISLAGLVPKLRQSLKRHYLRDFPKLQLRAVDGLLLRGLQLRVAWEVERVPRSFRLLHQSPILSRRKKSIRNLKTVRLMTTGEMLGIKDRIG